MEQWRHRWDPVMADVVPAHVTLAYPEEVVDEDLLLRRLERTLPVVAPFRLRLGEVFAEDGGRGGVFLAVTDVDGAWNSVRRQLLSTPMTPVDVAPHVTIAHPRTATATELCWAELKAHCLDHEFTVRELLFTETTHEAFSVLHRFRL